MRGDWRNYSDEQWMRLGGSVAACDSNHFRTCKSHWFLTPLAISAVFLLGPGDWTPFFPDGARSHMNQKQQAVLLAAVGTFPGVANAQNLLVNGSFEGNADPSTCVFVSPNPGSTEVPGWTVTGSANIDWVMVPPTCSSWPCPSDGVRYLDLNGSGLPQAPASAVSQTALLQPGAHYEFSVDAFNSWYQSPIGGTKILRVSIGGVASDFTLVTSQADSQCPFPLWQSCVVRFTAVQSQTIIELRSMFENNAGGIHVDAASLVEIPCQGDIDHSASVDGIDLAIVLQNWGIPSPKYPRSDVDGDGLVNGSDLALVLSNWGACP